MFGDLGNIFGDIFGGSTKPLRDNEQLIRQLFQFHASLVGSVRETLKEVSPEVAAGFDDKYIRLYRDIEKTHVKGSYEIYQLLGDELVEIKIDRPTENTWKAVFALINNKQEEFERLLEEGPSADEVKTFEEEKQKAATRNREQEERKVKLEARREKQKTCEHEFSENSSTGFFRLKDSKCTKCEFPNPENKKK